MHRTLRRARPAAVLTLALGAALGLPGAAFAGTTEPTPVTTTSTSSSTSTGTSSTTSSATSSGSTTTPPTTGSTTSTTKDPSTSSTTSTTSSSTSSTSTTSGPADPADASTAPQTARRQALAAPLAQVPFRAPSALRAALVPGDSSEQASYAAGFIARTLAERDDHYTYPGSTFFDGGNTIDAILGLAGAGAGLDQADASTDYLAAHVNGYVGYPGIADPSSPETYAGPLGKLVIGVVAQGGDPTSFGGQDLVTRLQGLMTSDGRFSDKSGFGDFSNTIGQALDIIAFGRATGSVAPAALDYLRDQQCADGGFRGNLDVADAACITDADATAFAAQALVGFLGADDPASVDALQWLASHQAPNGGFLNDDGQYNANTAGVAAQAFAAGGFTTQLASAQAFLAGLQLDCSFASALRGGIAFTAADYTTLKASPNTTAAFDHVVRATPQATLGLAGGSLLTVSAEGATASAPTIACSTTTTSATRPVTSTTTAAPAPAPAGPGDAASATPGNLAYTGADVAAMTLLGTVLLLSGAVAIRLARRKGVHA